MGTLASALGPHAARIAGQPRVYVDANMPASAVTFMRARLKWDALYVVEHDELRRATDGRHFHLAREFHRTLLTLDRDYLDQARFPPNESGGVLVFSAPDTARLLHLLTRVDAVLRTGARASGVPPLERQTLHIQVDWPGPA